VAVENASVRVTLVASFASGPAPTQFFGDSGSCGLQGMLTYMATLAKLTEDGTVVRIDVELDGRLRWRELYAYPLEGSPNFLVCWLQNTLPNLESMGIGEDETPVEQLYGLLDLYLTGEQLNLGDNYKPMHPHGDGVWELRTTDVRIFGWFPIRDHFVAVIADSTERVHQYGLHSPYRREVVRFRNSLNLDEPKFVAGVTENDILSICT
jgi:hypothetical protein